MKYNLVPAGPHITVIPLKPAEVQEYTGRKLADVETAGHDVLQYGRVELVSMTITDSKLTPVIKHGDIVLYPRLASDRTNFGDPRQVIVEVQHIKAYLKEVA